jgi:hypothetical protein
MAPRATWLCHFFPEGRTKCHFSGAKSFGLSFIEIDFDPYKCFICPLEVSSYLKKTNSIDIHDPCTSEKSVLGWVTALWVWVHPSPRKADLLLAISS